MTTTEPQVTTTDWTMDDVAYGIDGGREGIYDGVIVWVLKDGRRINRFADLEGMEHRAARIDAWLSSSRPEGEANTAPDTREASWA